jgi:quinol monooxygenase YgiN
VLLTAEIPQDKNDDGKLTPEEFREYFRDSHLRTADYERLFKAVDADDSGDISVEELFQYFAKEFEPFHDSFSATESLHAAINSTLSKTHAQLSAEASDDGRFQTHFQTRVLLRELLFQLEAAESVVERALDHVDALSPHSEQEHETIEVSDFHPSEMPQGYGSEGASAGAGDVTALAAQVSRLSQLVTKLDRGSVKFDVPDQRFDFGEVSDEEPLVAVHRHMKPDAKQMKLFTKAVTSYANQTRAEGSNREVFARTDSSGVFHLWEVWSTRAAYNEHYRTDHSKGLAGILCDVLEGPEEVSTMPVPSSWMA